MSLRVNDDEYVALLRRTGAALRVDAAKGKAKPAKYHNKRVTLDNESFDSQAEAKRWLELRALEAGWKIIDLRRQVPYEVTVCGKPICRYVADFVYQEKGNVVVEDVKGVKTPVYRLKKKLVEAVHGVRIKEVMMR